MITNDLRRAARCKCLIVNDLRKNVILQAQRAAQRVLFGFIYFTIFINQLTIAINVLSLGMENENDSLARLAHANGITDVEFEAQEKELARLARLEKILADVRNSDEPAEMPEVHRNHEEPSYD